MCGIRKYDRIRSVLVPVRRKHSESRVMRSKDQESFPDFILSQMRRFVFFLNNAEAAVNGRCYIYFTLYFFYIRIKIVFGIQAGSRLFMEVFYEIFDYRSRRHRRCARL